MNNSLRGMVVLVPVITLLAVLTLILYAAGHEGAWEGSARGTYSCGKKGKDVCSAVFKMTMVLAAAAFVDIIQIDTATGARTETRDCTWRSVGNQVFVDCPSGSRIIMSVTGDRMNGTSTNPNSNVVRYDIDLARSGQ